MTTEKPAGYRCTGIATLEELENADLLPPQEVYTKKRVAFIECIESIPCDACKFACKFDAVIKPTIITPPKVDWEKCTGCMRCVIECPGLTIFMIDGRKQENKVVIIIPYEFLPFPKKEDKVILLNRKGEPIGKGSVTMTLDPARNQQTGLVGVLTPTEIWKDVRSVRLE